MTLRFLADENFNRAIVTGVQREVRDVDIALVQDVDLRTADDPTILRWAAGEGRAVLSHDLATMPDFAYERIVAGLPMPGLFVVRSTVPVATAIEELVHIAGASKAGEWSDRVTYLPLR